MSNDINTLRAHLFDCLAGLKDGSVPLERAKAVSEVAQTIINSAKVEVECAKATGYKGSSFLEVKEELPPGITGITRHRLMG
jgi:hypothetical protein